MSNVDDIQTAVSILQNELIKSLAIRSEHIKKTGMMSITVSFSEVEHDIKIKNKLEEKIHHLTETIIILKEGV